MDVLAIPALLVFTVFVFGVGLALGALHVFFRDIGLLWGALLPAFFYLTPIAYPPDLVPEDLRWIAGINPLYWYVDLFRTVVSERLVPGVEQWVRVVLLSLVSLTAGMLVFRSLRPGFIANY